MKFTRFSLWSHKWIGIVMGVIVVVWLASGMIMILPYHPLVEAPPDATPQMTDATVSPAEAIRIVREREHGESALKKVQLVGVDGEPYYRIDLAKQPKYLIHARTGERLVIDSAVAERLARRGFAKTLPIRSVSKQTERTLTNPVGPVPAYRIDFADERHTVALVNMYDGTVLHTNTRRRLMSIFAGLHTFEPIEQILERDGPKKWSLHITSIISIILCLTGYYVVLPRRWRRRWETGSSSARGESLA